MTLQQLSFESVSRIEQDDLRGNEKRIISRLLIQKILTSGASNYISRRSYEHLSNMFLSEKPEEQHIELTFRTIKEKENESYSYYGTNTIIALLTFQWGQDASTLQDLDGNLWAMQPLGITCRFMASGACDTGAAVERAECLNFIVELMKDVTEMVPGPLKYMKYTNSQRIELEMKSKYDKACQHLTEHFQWAGRRDRMGLRVGGKSRALDRAQFNGIEPGTYVFFIAEGKRSNSRSRKYSVTIPENESYRPYITRIN